MRTEIQTESNRHHRIDRNPAGYPAVSLSITSFQTTRGRIFISKQTTQGTFCGLRFHLKELAKKHTNERKIHKATSSWCIIFLLTCEMVKLHFRAAFRKSFTCSVSSLVKFRKLEDSFGYLPWFESDWQLLAVQSQFCRSELGTAVFVEVLHWWRCSPNRLHIK